MIRKTPINGYWCEYFDNWKIYFEWEFKDWKRNGWGKEYVLMWDTTFLRQEWFYVNWDIVNGTQYDPSNSLVYIWDFQNNEWNGKGKIYDKNKWVIYYRWEFKGMHPHWKWKLYENGVLAYDWLFFEGKRDGFGKYYKDWKLIYEWEFKQWKPINPREWYSENDEKQRYYDDDGGNLRWRFWSQMSMLDENW